MHSSGWSGRIGTEIEAMEEAFGLKFMKKRDVGRFHRTVETCGVLPAFSKNVRTCRRKSEVHCFCVDVDLGAWEKPTTMSATAGAGEFDDVWRSGRRLLGVHQIGGLMGLLLWMNGKVGSRMKPWIISTLETTLSLNPRLRPSWMPKNPTFEVLATLLYRITRTVRQSPKRSQTRSREVGGPALDATSVEKLVNAVECFQRKASKHRKITKVCELFPAIWELLAILGARITFGESDKRRNGGNALRWKRMRQTKANSRTRKFSECAIAQVVRYKTWVARKH